MSVREAAIQILMEVDTPLHAQEIAKRILDRKLWQTTGKTPSATVSARLYSDIKKNGDKSPFVLVASQTFGLRDSGAMPITKKPSASPTLKKSPETFSFTNAAEKVLEQFGDKRPLHYRGITKKALELGWLNTEGKTPEATMYAQILTEIRRYKKRGEQSRFVQHGRGYIGLSRWMGKGLAFEIEQHNKRVRQTLHKQLLEMDPTAFEELIARLLVEIGFEDVVVTKRSGDGGIDVRGTLVIGDVIRTRMAVQVKRWKPKNRVQATVVRDVRGSLGIHEQGLIVTTSDFVKGARDEAARPDAVPVGLMNGEQLVALLAENDIGVTRHSHDLIELGEDEGMNIGESPKAT
jgi:restriction system protein